MLVPIYIFPQKFRNGKFEHDLVPTHIGYAEVETFDAEQIWGLCNWGEYAEQKPENLFATISTCGHGLCVINPETQEYHLALSHGWLVGTEKEISDYVFEHRHDVIWN